MYIYIFLVTLCCFSFAKLLERYQQHNAEEIAASKNAGGTDKVSQAFYPAQN